jgi:hypothetical protein
MEGRRAGSVGADVFLQVADLFLRGAGGIGAGYEAAQRRLPV